MIYFLFFAVITFNAFAESEIKSENSINDSTEISGNIEVYGAYNNTAFSPILPAPSQAQKYMALEGNFRVRNLTLFGKGQELKYGLTMEGEIDSTDSSNPIYIKELNFIISTSDTGSRLFGLQSPVASKMRVDSTILSPYAGGINGKWQNSLIFPSQSFIVTQGSFIENGFASTYFMAGSENGLGLQPYENWGNSGLGLSYITDRKNGVRFGATYIPDNRTNLLLKQTSLEDEKNITGINNESGVYLSNIISVALNYYNSFNDVEIALSSWYERGTAVSSTYAKKDLNSYSVGLNLSYLGVSFGGSITNFGKSLQVFNAFVPGNNSFYNNEGILENANGSYVWDVGLGYAIERYTTSVSFLKSNYVNNVFWAGVFSFETKVTANFINYFQVVRYQFSEPNTTNMPALGQKASGFIFIVGIKYNFSK